MGVEVAAPADEQILLLLAPDRSSHRKVVCMAAVVQCMVVASAVAVE